MPQILFQVYAASESVINKTGTSDFNFVVAGDFSCNKEAKKTVNNMATKKPEIVLTVGDHSYRKSADCWFTCLHHGFLNLEVTNHGSNMTGTFYDNNGLINEDQFTILKKDKTP